MNLMGRLIYDLNLLCLTQAVHYELGSDRAVRSDHDFHS